jgi:hypothetical protein
VSNISITMAGAGDDLCRTRSREASAGLCRCAGGGRAQVGYGGTSASLMAAFNPPDITSPVPQMAFLYHFFAAIDMFSARQRGDWGAGRAATYNR